VVRLLNRLRSQANTDPIPEGRLKPRQLAGQERGQSAARPPKHQAPKPLNIELTIRVQDIGTVWLFQHLLPLLGSLVRVIVDR